MGLCNKEVQHYTCTLNGSVLIFPLALIPSPVSMVPNHTAEAGQARKHFTVLPNELGQGILVREVPSMTKVFQTPLLPRPPTPSCTHAKLLPKANVRPTLWKTWIPPDLTRLLNPPGDEELRILEPRAQGLHRAPRKSAPGDPEQPQGAYLLPSRVSAT